MTKKVVIVGAGHAAGQLAASLRQKNFTGSVALLGEEPYLPYQRPPLSKKFLAGELPPERLYVKPAAYYDQSDIEVRLDTQVTRIERDDRHVVDSAGNHYRYDKLVLATGASVRKLDVDGADLQGVHYLRNIEDVTAIRRSMQPDARLVVIGAGYIGLEVAAVANSMGLKVTVIETAERVMSRVVSPLVSDFYQSEHRKRGVEILLGTTLRGFSGDTSAGTSVKRVNLSDDTSIAADIALIGIGVIPNCTLAEQAGLKVDNGIRVDDCCRTSDPDIYAVGDCTNHPNELLGRRLRLESVHNALEQAKTAAGNICGDDVHYSQVPWFWSDQYDLKLQIAGVSDGYDRTVLRGDPAERAFSCLYLRDRQLIAIDSINAPKDFMQSKPLIADRAVISPDTLANPDLALKELI